MTDDDPFIEKCPECKGSVHSGMAGRSGDECWANFYCRACGQSWKKLWYVDEPNKFRTEVEI